MSMMNTQQPLYHGSPPSRGGNGVVIALVVAIVVAVVGFGGWWFLGNQDSQQAQPLPQPQPQTQTEGQPEPQQPAPTQSEAEQQPQSQTPTPERSPAQSERQQDQQPRQQPSQEERKPQPQPTDQDETPPVMPESFGQFKSDSTRLSSSLGTYRDADSRFLMFMHIGGISAEDMKKYSRNEVREVGGWYCTTLGEGAKAGLDCDKSIHGGSLSVTGSAERFTEEELVAIGDEFIAAWK
ncbi:MAG: hypothetical protein Q4D89_06620 [Arachnia propionica]|uniref:hypothetical protein n=1 Tax=Arachnia propionica TaxID=1750 RepID=UPI00270CAA3C|nr:hypothetical protein [Arachnia propionica]